MNEQSIFLKALEFDDAHLRAGYLARACGDNLKLRKQVDALLEEHERSGEFLNVPALEQIRKAEAGSPAIGNEKIASDEGGEMDFSFLQPSETPGSIGRLGHYDIREMIGRGGCGIVFKAFDERLHRIVAIKVMTPEMAVTSPARRRFIREARATAAIRHESVASIHAVEESPIPFLVMEYIDGKTLQQLVDETGPLDLQDILRFGRMIANGLDAAHQKGLIHRDIKPANILIDSGTGKIKITDFGLARAADDASRSQSGVIAGTPLYMSPEQVQGCKLDQRSDLFSLGSVLYVMCSGRPPFRASSVLAVLKRVVDEEPRNIHEIIPEVPDWLVAIVSKLHAKDPAERYASAQEVANLLAHPPIAIACPANSVTDRPSMISRTGRQNHLWWMAAATLLVILSSLGVTEATGITNVRGAVIRLFSPEGTLVVEVDDPEVNISLDGEQLVITGAGANEIRVKPGQHRVTASKDGEVLLQEFVTISRDGRQVVRVSREAVPASAIRGIAPNHSDSPLFQAGSIWTGLNTVEMYRGNAERNDYPARLIVIERIGEKFKARFEGVSNSRLVTGTIRQGVLQWSKADVTAEKGSIGFDHAGTVIDDRIELSYQGFENDGTESKGVMELRFVNSGPMPPQPEDQLAFFNSVAKLPLSEQASAVGKKLAEINPGFDGKVTGTIDEECVVSLYLRGDAIKYIWPVRALPRLTKLQCIGANVTFGKLSDLSPLAGMPITTLDIGNSSVSDLSPLKEMPLENLYLSHTKVSDLSQVSELPLKLLWLQSCPHITDLSQLSGMQLETLCCDWTQISDLSPLQGMPLSRLRVRWTQVSDLSPLRGSPLVEFQCSNTQVTDLSPLEGAPLKQLHMEDIQVSSLSPIGGMPIETLKLSPLLACLNVRQLKAIPSLKTVNDQPAQTYLDSLQPIATDSDRRAAEYVLSIGGKVWINKESAGTDGNAIQSIDKLPADPFCLTHVDLKGNHQVTDAGLEAFRGTTNLRGIYLTHSPNVGDTGVSHLRENRYLHEIHLWGTKVSGSGLKAFIACPEIVDLYLGYTRVTDTDMIFFRDCASRSTLRCVMLSGLGISDHGLAHLAGLPKLGQVNLEHTKITDSGLLELATCPDLGVIHAEATGLTSEGIQQFSRLKQSCKVIRP